MAKRPRRNEGWATVDAMREPIRRENRIMAKLTVIAFGVSKQRAKRIRHVYLLETNCDPGITYIAKIDTDNRGDNSRQSWCVLVAKE